MTRRRIIVYVATSADGFIARKDGRVDWLDRPHWIMGGAGLIASFVDAGEVDDFIVHVIPTFIGEGIPLIAPAERTLPATLKGTKPYEDGVVRLHYAT